MLRIAICTAALLVSVAGSPALASPEKATLALTADSIKADLATSEHWQTAKSQGEMVTVDSKGWVEEEYVVVLTPDGRNADILSDSVKVALEEDQIKKLIAKHAKKKLSNSTVAKSKN